MISPSTEDVLFALGGEAVRLCMPNNPHASLSVALGELKREGFPHIPSKDALAQLRNHNRPWDKVLAGEYLNIVFGWKPLMADVKRVLKAQSQADKIWRQYVRNSNRPVRRHREFEPEESTVTTTLTTNGYGYPVGSSYLHKQPGTVTKTVHTVTKHWFDGCFRYHIPEPVSQSKRAQRQLDKIRLLYGLDFDPLTLWNLIPWSWLVDWFADFSGLLQTLSNYGHDGLVMQYGYLCEHKIVETTYTLQGHAYAKGGSADSSVTHTQETKCRVRAHPFGFGVHGELTMRQLAILAAVGITLR